MVASELVDLRCIAGCWMCHVDLQKDMPPRCAHLLFFLSKCWHYFFPEPSRTFENAVEPSWSFENVTESSSSLENADALARIVGKKSCWCEQFQHADRLPVHTRIRVRASQRQPDVQGHRTVAAPGLSFFLGGGYKAGCLPSTRRVAYLDILTRKIFPSLFICQ